jgi:hypothetical protein
MVQMMKSLQHNIINKLAISSDFKSLSTQNLKDLIETVLPLGFSQNTRDIQNLSLILQKSIQQVEQVQIFDRNPSLVDLLIAVIHYWLSSPHIKQEVFVLQSLIEFLDIIVYSPNFWMKFKGSQALNLFIQT